MRVGDVLLRINGQRAVGHAEATQLLRACRGDLRLEISRSQQPIAATTLQRYWRGLSARRATAARRDAARRDARPAPAWPPQEVVTANEALLSAAVDRAARHKATEHVVSFRRERREATGYARSQAWREGEAAKEARAGAAKAGAPSSTAARRREHGREHGEKKTGRTAVAAQPQEAAASPGSPGLARLKAELEGMKLGALARRAVQLGVDASALDAAEDTDDPKAATIQLILVEQALLGMP